jgi:hypothetical protein
MGMGRRAGGMGMDGASVRNLLMSDFWHLIGVECLGQGTRWVWVWFGWVLGGWVGFLMGEIGCWEL